MAEKLTNDYQAVKTSGLDTDCQIDTDIEDLHDVLLAACILYIKHLFYGILMLLVNATN